MPASASSDRCAGVDSRFSRVFAVSPVALALVGRDGVVLEVNPALVRLLELPPERIVGRPALEFSHPEDRQQALAVARTALDADTESLQLSQRVYGGDRRAHLVRVTMLLLQEPGGVPSLLVQLEDLSPDVELARMQREAAEDPLTGVANRRALVAQLRVLLQAQPQLASGEQPTAAGWSLLFIDLDGFKQINDQYGHAVGDRVLVAVSRRLNRITRARDLVCRLGGDEFVLLLDTAAGADVARMAQRVRRSLAQPVGLGAETVSISASVGAASPRPGDSVEDLLNRADWAMYQDKRGSEPDRHAR